MTLKLDLIITITVILKIVDDTFATKTCCKINNQ